MEAMKSNRNRTSNCEHLSHGEYTGSQSIRSSELGGVHNATKSIIGSNLMTIIEPRNDNNETRIGEDLRSDAWLSLNSCHRDSMRKHTVLPAKVLYSQNNNQFARKNRITPTLAKIDQLLRPLKANIPSNGLRCKTSGMDDKSFENTSSDVLPKTITSHGESLCHAQQNQSSTSKFNRTDLCDRNELPDALSDFILSYSRTYFGSSSSTYTSLAQASINDGYKIHENRNDQFEIRNPTEHEDFDLIILVEERKTSAVADAVFTSMQDKTLCNSNVPQYSPLHARSAPQFSPNIPSETVFFDDRIKSGFSARGILKTKPTERGQSARDRLRALLDENDLNEAWAWTCKCIQHFPDALAHRDADGDSLLHIVIMHMDFAKIYALVEQVRKMDPSSKEKLIDLTNRFNETPLFLAVVKNSAIVVEYLLEAGSNPNTHNSRDGKDLPLHYASSRGMREIVQILCLSPIVTLNSVNDNGLTPLLCAVKNHMNIEENYQVPIDNKLVIEVLLKSGADPFLVDTNSGKNIMHYAVESTNVELIQFIENLLDSSTISSLLNMTERLDQTPLELLVELKNSLCDNTRCYHFLHEFLCFHDSNSQFQ